MASRSNTNQPATTAAPQAVSISYTAGVWEDGQETAVSAAAVIVLPANADRKKYIVQNTGSGVIRVGNSAVTATTGTRLTPGGHLLYEEDFCPTEAIYALREGATDSVAFAQEVTG